MECFWNLFRKKTFYKSHKQRLKRFPRNKTKLGNAARVDTAEAAQIDFFSTVKKKCVLFVSFAVMGIPMLSFFWPPHVAVIHRNVSVTCCLVNVLSCLKWICYLCCESILGFVFLFLLKAWKLKWTVSNYAICVFLF